MERLIELVAASFVRHGIECPADLSAVSRPASAPGVISHAVISATPQVEPAALPEHSFRKRPQAEFAL